MVCKNLPVIDQAISLSNSSMVSSFSSSTSVGLSDKYLMPFILNSILLFIRNFVISLMSDILKGRANKLIVCSGSLSSISSK